MKKGLVIKSTGSWYSVKDDNGRIVPCRIRGNYRIKGIRATNPVAVGDIVTYKLADDDNSGVITQIGERKNYIIRRASNLSKEYQLIAANIDKAFLIISLVKPKTLPVFIDRFLVSAQSFRIPVIILISKIDLYNKTETEEMKTIQAMYSKIGYPTIPVSFRTGENLEEVIRQMENELIVVSGNSGVGKSTLINFLEPNLNLKTQEISDSNKTGRHTTTFAEMFFLQSGIRIIDTPGIKGFGMVDIEKEELFHFFPEIFKYSSKCRFHNCLHINEPGCAVITSVEEGNISLSRYTSYLSLMADLDDKYRK